MSMASELYSCLTRTHLAHACVLVCRLELAGLRGLILMLNADLMVGRDITPVGWVQVLPLWKAQCVVLFIEIHPDEKGNVLELASALPRKFVG